MRRPLVVANWKMYTNLSDAVVLSTSLRESLENLTALETVICPPAIWLVPVAEILNREISHISVGAQNVSHLNEGEYTGEISAQMVRDVGKYSIVGHSERRKNFAEDNKIIARKVATCIENSIIPIICVGEDKKSHTSPREVVGDLKECLSHIEKDQYENVVVAYEPVWAVGAKEPAEPEYAARVMAQLREIVGAKTSIIYGGTVNSENVFDFVRRPEIDGVLVGRASLKADDFIKICRIVSEYKRII